MIARDVAPARRRTLLSVAVTLLGVALLALGVTHLRHPAPRHAVRPFVSSTKPQDDLHRAGPPATASTSSATPTPPQRSAVNANGDGVPLRIQIQRLHVDASIVPVGSQGDTIGVPADPAVLGWWTGSAPPGSSIGDTVIVGHVDSAERGVGALFHLDRVRAADRIELSVSGGRTQRYRVTALRVISKASGLSTRELGTNGPPQLTLITCGGPFDRHTGNYRDNIVTYATPVDS